MVALFDILIGAPWWACALFVYGVVRGIMALKLRTVPLFHLMIMPAIFLGWSLSAKVLYGYIACVTILAWVGAVVVGPCVGWHLFYYGHVVGKVFAYCTSILE